MKITWWKGVFVADVAPNGPESKLLRSCGFELHEPTLCRPADCRGCWAKIGRRYYTTRLEDATRLQKYCTQKALDVMRTHLHKLAMSRAVDSDIKIPAPPGLSYRPFQRAGIAYASAHKDTMLGDDMGLGKTIQALGFWNLIHPKSILVVCPTTLALNWQLEAEKWLVDDYKIMLPESTTDVVPPPVDGERILVIVNYEKITGRSVSTRQIAVDKIDSRHPTNDVYLVDVEALKSHEDKKKSLVVVLAPDEPGLPYRVIRGDRYVATAKRLNWPVVRCSVVPADTKLHQIDQALKSSRDTPLGRSLKRPWDSAAFDEAQALKNPESLRSIAVLGEGGLYHRTKRNLFLTGTPVENYTREIWPIAAAVCPAKFGDWWEFATRYCGLHTEKRGKSGRSVVVADGFTRQAELQQRLRTTFLIRRRKVDVLKELPPKMRQLMVLDDSGVDWSQFPEFQKWQEATRRAYDAKMASLEAARTDQEYRAAVRDLKTVSVAFTEISKYRHAVGLLKLPVCLQFSDEQLASGLDSLVIFAHHRDVIEKIHEHYGDDACVIHGDTPPEERIPIVQRFQRKEKKILVGALRAAGTGITLTRSAALDFFETDWNPATIRQAEDRLVRIGQTRTVNVVFPVLNQSLDCNMLQKILRKESSIEKLLDEHETAKS